MEDRSGLSVIFLRRSFKGRNWFIGECANGHLSVATRCLCGNVMHALVISLGDPPFEVRCLDIGCSASDRRFFAAALRIPERLAEQASEMARERADRAWRVRAASGGPRGWIPV